MGISRIAFLFDVDKFTSTFQPLIGELENNNYGNLRTVSTQKVKNNPRLWKVLDYFGYFESDIGREEEEFDTIESRVMFWINILIADSCLVAVTDPVNARTIGEILPLLKIEFDIISKLQVGKPFDVLLFPQRGQDELPFWCKRFSVGWLSKEDCQEIFLLLEKVYSALIAQDLVLKGNLEDALPVLNNLMDMLSSAFRKEKGLLLGYSA